MSDTASVLRAWIDSPADGISAAQGTVRVSGWVFDEAGPIEDARLLVGDGPGEPVNLGLWRSDVGDAHPEIPHAAASGFEGTVDLRAAPSETVRLALLVRTGDGEWREARAVAITAEGPVRERHGRRRRAAFTIVHNEPVMLPLWLNYYGRFFDADDLFVLDHDSTDGSTAALGDRCRVTQVHREAAFDHHWLKTTVEAFQAFLLQSYEAVLFAEVDEFVVADPRRYPGLDDYIERLTGPAARCSGFNVVHQPDEEPPLRFDEAPLLQQRRHWHASLEYSKRLVSRVPLRWSDGFHFEHRAPDDPPDPDLMLVHLHRVDYEWCRARHAASAARDWSEDDLRRGQEAHNWIGWDDFDEWFRRGPDLDAPRELIPEHIRSVL